MQGKYNFDQSNFAGLCGMVKNAVIYGSDFYKTPAKILVAYITLQKVIAGF